MTETTTSDASASNRSADSTPDGWYMEVHRKGKAPPARYTDADYKRIYHHAMYLFEMRGYVRATLYQVQDGVVVKELTLRRQRDSYGIDKGSTRAAMPKQIPA